MRKERIELIERERDRRQGLPEIQQGHLKQVEAGLRLRLTDRQVRRLRARLRTEGDRGLAHQRRGRRLRATVTFGATRCRRRDPHNSRALK